MEIAEFIKTVNELADNNKLFWLAGLISETWEALIDHMDELDPLAQTLVTKYSEQEI